jgi:hypothetical protein
MWTIICLSVNLGFVAEIYALRKQHRFTETSSKARIVSLERSTMARKLTLGILLIEPGDDFCAITAKQLLAKGLRLLDGDVLVHRAKIISRQKAAISTDDNGQPIAQHVLQRKRKFRLSHVSSPRHDNAASSARSGSQKREARKGETSIPGGAPVTKAAMSSAVIGAPVRPRCPLPKA